MHSRGVTSLELQPQSKYDKQNKIASVVNFFVLQVAVFLGPVIACLFSVFGFCIRYFDTPIFFRWMFHVSYYRAGFQGIVYSIYGLNRQKLDCPEEALYCHYSDPTNFLKEMDIMDVDLVSNISVIVVIWCLMHAATYLTLWIKLNKR